MTLEIEDESETVAYEIRDVPGFPGYSVSTNGDVFNQYGNRLAQYKDTRPGKGHLAVELWRDGKAHRVKVHLLVLSVFVGPRPEGLETRHLDGNPENNRVENLRYGTSSENSLDQVRHGTHPYASRTHCKNAHEFTRESHVVVLETKRNGRTIKRRKCLICQAQNELRRKANTQIRDEHANGVWTIADLAFIYDMPVHEVAAIIYGPNWQFLDADELDCEGIANADILD